jgi:predicted nuclease of restriction endonuclease-like (RecB) superfamily
MTDQLQKAGTLFDRVVSIIEQARTSAVHTVNRNTILAYWFIGREIVEAIQMGQERAEYGKQVIEKLSNQLTEKYGKGFSVTNLKYFRMFYQAYSNRIEGIGHLPGDQSLPLPKSHPLGDEFEKSATTSQNGLKSLNHIEILHSQGGELKISFHPNLSWSHYRALMRVDNQNARIFYETEAAECGWSKAQLERQIQSSYYERILKKKGKKGLLPVNRERLPGDSLEAVHLLKAPYVLEFLDLPDSPVLHENQVEQEIINNLQSFLLELGKGFAFVSRQKHIRIDDDDFYVDLVFYNFILKFFLLIDLKIGKLTHRDVGQMDGYVRLFEDRFKISGDNPTVGLILCSDKSKTVVK